MYIINIHFIEVHNLPLHYGVINCICSSYSRSHDNKKEEIKNKWRSTSIELNGMRWWCWHCWRRSSDTNDCHGETSRPEAITDQWQIRALLARTTTRNKKKKM